jgi:alkanesulfonate monooxygenase SsuD/methylene tetrahydromethanopterin reductase-like flavin-dependent oxidoreductase (luciferase family)
MNDHLTDMDPTVPGPSLEAMTLLATLVHHVPGMRVGHAVLSNTFRHPVLVAKAAVVMDHATGGNFVLGLGAGWFEEEHAPFGIDLPPIGERISRLESSVDTLRALFGPEAAGAPGVTRDDPYYPLRGATNLPAPLTPGGPPIFLGGQKPRGIRLAARAAQGWLLPGTEAGDDAYFREKRDRIVAALEDAGRDPSTFELIGQVSTGADATSRARALEQSHRLVAAGATEIVLGMPAALGPAGLDDVHRDILLPLREASGR